MDLEKIFLGSVMIKPDIAPDVIGDLELELFSEEIRPVCAALIGLFDATGKLDVVAAMERYPALKVPIVECVESIESECIRPTRENILNWLQMLKENRAAEKFRSIALESCTQAMSFEDLQESYEKMGKALDIESKGDDFESFGDLVDDYIRSLGDKPEYIPTGLSKLDRNLHILPGNFILIGGRPSAGKTALSLQLAVEMALRGYRVCYFSLETSTKVLIRRAIANRTCSPLADVQNKRVPVAELDCLARPRKAPLFFRSASGKSVSWIKAQAMRKKAQIVFIDYVQLLSCTEAKDRYTQITKISIALHEMAQSTGMVIIGLSQLKRNETHADPTLSDLRESGQLEQDADAAILLGGAEHPFILAKNKEGEAGIWFNIVFNKEKQRFLEVTP